MFVELEEICSRPRPFQFYTASDLWTNEHISKQMLSYHLDGEVDISSRKTSFIDRSVSWISSRFNVGVGTQIADFGCGPGLYSRKLAQRQASVVGIDFSKRSIQYAKEEAQHYGLTIDYVNQNYLAYETDERFNLIVMIMCDFCALSPAQRRGMLTKFHTFLAPNGSVLLDVYSLSAFDQVVEKSMYEANLMNGFWSANKYYGFLNTFKYDIEKVSLDKYTIVEADRARIVYNWLQYFDLDGLKKEFSDCGFSVEGVFADVAGSPYVSDGGEFAIVGKKI